MNGNLTNIRHLLSSRNFKLINGDIRNFDLLEKIIKDVDVVFHLAAQIHVDRSIVEPRLTYEINVLGTQNILEVSRMYDVERIIHASTSEVYGSSIYAPMDEKHPLNAAHPYGASKVASDRLCFAYNMTYGMNIFVIRPFNIFGPKQKDSGYGGVISMFTRRVLADQPPIIYGDGQQSRDYTYVDDIVRAYDLILNYEGQMNEPINFGTGKEIKILDLANFIISICGKQDKLRPVHVEERPGEVQRLISDITLARKMGWKPMYSIEEGLKTYIDWYKNYKMDEWTKPS
jgi:UDP-glucose 4-epimerase